MNNFRPFLLRIWSMRLHAAEDAGFDHILPYYYICLFFQIPLENLYYLF